MKHNFVTAAVALQAETAIVQHCLWPHTSLQLCLSICAYYSPTGLTSTLINLSFLLMS